MLPGISFRHMVWENGSWGAVTEPGKEGSHVDLGGPGCTLCSRDVSVERKGNQIDGKEK